MPGREIKVAIIGDPSSLQRALNTADQGVNRFGQRMQQVGGRLRNFGSSMTRNLTLPIIGFGALAFRELNAGAEAMAQTRAVIESTGGAARQSVHDIADLAGELSELSSIDDEDLQGMLNKLLTFMNIAPSNFDAAAAAVTDLSVAMGQDLSASAVQVGKALNNPIAGLTALQRVGVQFSERQREWIEHLVEMGDVAGAQRVILAELNREFAGSAEAFGTTPAARLRRLGQRFEELGASILEDALPALEDFAGIIENLANKYDELTPAQQKFVAGAIAVAAVAGPLTSVVGLLTSGLGALAAALGVSAGIIGAIVVALGALAFSLYIVITRWDEVKLTASNAIQNIINLVPGARQHIEGLRAAIGAISGVARAVGGAVAGLIGAVARLGGMALDGIIGAFNALQSVIRGALDMVFAFVDAVQAAASAVTSLPSRIPGVVSGPRSVSGQKVRGPARVSSEESMERAFRRALRSEVQLVKAIA